MEESKCPAGGGWEPIFSKFRTVLGTLQGTGVTTMDRIPCRQGESRPEQGRAGGCRYPAAQAAVLLPLPVSTQTEGTKIGAHTYGSVMLLNIFNVANLVSRARFKHAAGAGLDGDCGSQPWRWFACHYPRVAASVQEPHTALTLLGPSL